MSQLIDEAQALFSYTQKLRRDFHRNPELGFQEFRTAGIVAQELSRLGLEVHSGIAKTGVVAMLEGEQPGPTVLVRFDMDALPIQEENDTIYCSQSPGLMHACGHDGHVAIGLTVASLLSKERSQLHGSVKFVFQPAEEGLGGAEAMIREGVLANPAPDYCLSLHLWNEKPVGWYGITAGPLMAGSDIFKIRVTGKGGHGALPHQTIDPVVAGATMINALQTIVSRNISPLQSAVVSVARLRAGEAFNVIPQEAELAGTIRSFEPEVRAVVLERMQAVVNGIAAAMSCTAEFTLTELTPPVINQGPVVDAVTRALTKTMPEAILEPNCRTMVSEDMAFIQQKVPGCYFLVGSANQARGLNFSHHHPKFDFDEAALPGAAALMAASVLEILS